MTDARVRPQATDRPRRRLLTAHLSPAWLDTTQLTWVGHNHGRYLGMVRRRRLWAIGAAAGIAATIVGGTTTWRAGAQANVSFSINAFDRVSLSYTPGNTAGYAEQQAIPFRTEVDGGSSPATIVALQTVFDHSDNTGTPGIKDLGVAGPYNTPFAVCTGAKTSTPPGAQGCTPLPVVAPAATPPASGAYVQGPYLYPGVTPCPTAPTTTTSCYYRWSNIGVPANKAEYLAWGAILALGSHAYGGASLHMSLGNAVVNGATTSVGNQDIPIPVKQIIALAVAKKVNGSSTPAPVNVGDTVTVSITAQTFGPSKSTQDVTLTDQLPSCLRYDDSMTSTITPTSFNVSSPDAGGTVDVVWFYQALHDGSTVTVTFKAIAMTPGTCVNVATVSSPQAPSPPPSTVPLPISGVPDLSITKTCPANAAPGETVTHTLTYSNQGTADAAGTTITDVLGSGLAYVDGSAAPITPTVQANTPSAGQTTLLFNLGTVPAGAAPQTISYQVTVAPTGTAGAQTFTDTATIATTSTERNTANNSSTCSTAASYAPDLSVLKQCPSSAQLNSTVDHTITYANHGTAPATGVAITDTLDPGLRFVEGSATLNGSAITPSSESVNGNGQTVLVFSIGTVNPGDSGTLQYSVKVVQTGPQSDTASIAENETDANTADNTATCTTGIAAADVFITKECPSNAQPGATATHTLHYGNGGNESAAGVVITDVLGAGLTYVDGSASMAPSSVVSNADGTTTLTWDLGSVDPAQTGTISYDVTVPPTASSAGAQSFTDSAAISTSTVESDTGNNASGPCVTTVTYAPALQVSKSSCPSTAVAPGGVVVYTISYSNTGTAPATQAQLVDTIPAGTALAAGSSSSWSLGTLAPGASGTRTLTVLLTTANNGDTLVDSVVLSSPDGPSASFSLPLVVSNAGATTSASSYAISVSALGSPVIPPSLASAATSASSPAKPTDVGDQDNLSQNTVTVPGVASAGYLLVTSHSELADEAYSRATAETLKVNLLGGLVTADAVYGLSESVASSQGATDASTGSTIANLTIAGLAYPNVAPNTTVTVMNPLAPGAALARVVLYEQKGSSSLSGGFWTSGLSVNMIHVTLLEPFMGLPQGAEIVVSHAESLASYPNGLGCGAAVSSVSGFAYAAFAEGRFGSPAAPLVTVQQGDAILPATGGSASDQLAGVAVPNALTTGAATDQTSGALSPDAHATASSVIHSIDVLNGTVTADLVDVSSTSHADGTAATTAFGSTCGAPQVCAPKCPSTSPCFVNLSVGGSQLVGLDGGDVAPNTTIALPDAQGGLLLVVLNEQIPGGNGTTTTSGVVNAIHVTVLSSSGVVTGEVIVAHAESDAEHP